MEEAIRQNLLKKGGEPENKIKSNSAFQQSNTNSIIEIGE